MSEPDATDAAGRLAQSFGYREVDPAAKAGLVRGVFDRVARRYDLMNDLMSGGVHRLWKEALLDWLAPRPGIELLDVAGGTGDIALRLLDRLNGEAQVTLADINEAMLRTGRDRLLDAGVALPPVVCDAEKLPFPDNRFDFVSVAFGLRNMTHKDLALKEMNRVLKPRGKLLVLEFSKVAKPLSKVYDWYSFSVLPRLGKVVAGDDASYRYLAESIRMHPSQEELKTLMKEGGFGHVDYHNMTGGVVALHVGIKC
jgi:demethylmenaquinone methyltransferase / 2-methoxy-6-polyprenyl-1,4-benzoquinol methylase